MFLVFYVILRDHNSKELGNFKGKSPSRYVIILSSLVAIDSVKIKMFVAWSRKNI